MAQLVVGALVESRLIPAQGTQARRLKAIHYDLRFVN